MGWRSRSERPTIKYGYLYIRKEEIDKFLKRRRRIKFEENEFEGKLDLMLMEILQKANEFVPSESGSILLDEPEKKSPFLKE